MPAKKTSAKKPGAKKASVKVTDLKPKKNAMGGKEPRPSQHFRLL
jgi:hypothetical protein